MKLHILVVVQIFTIVVQMEPNNSRKGFNNHVLLSNRSEYLFSARIVGIFVADSELPYTLELAKPSIEIAIEKVVRILVLGSKLIYYILSKIK